MWMYVSLKGKICNLGGNDGVDVTPHIYVVRPGGFGIYYRETLEPRILYDSMGRVTCIHLGEMYTRFTYQGELLVKIEYCTPGGCVWPDVEEAKMFYENGKLKSIEGKRDKGGSSRVAVYCNSSNEIIDLKGGWRY